MTMDKLPGKKQKLWTNLNSSPSPLIFLLYMYNGSLCASEDMDSSTQIAEVVVLCVLVAWWAGLVWNELRGLSLYYSKF